MTGPQYNGINATSCLTVYGLSCPKKRLSLIYKSAPRIISLFLICTSSSSRIPCNPTWRLVVQTHSCCSAFLLITQLEQRNSIGLMGVATGGWCGYIGYHGNMEQTEIASHLKSTSHMSSLKTLFLRQQLNRQSVCFPSRRLWNRAPFTAQIVFILFISKRTYYE